MPDLSVADKLLIAASRLSREGDDPFSAEDLVVAAWEEFPETFGLRGYLDEQQRPRYPDSNRVFAEIMGSKPLRGRGFVEKVGNKQYRLTDAGRSRIAEVTGRSSTRKAALSRKTLDELRRLLSSRAVGKYREGRASDLTFLDACAFWGISPRSNSKDLAARVSHFNLLLTELEAITGSDDFVLEHGAVSYSAEDRALLRELSQELTERYEAELDVIRQRRDER